MNMSIDCDFKSGVESVIVTVDSVWVKVVSGVSIVLKLKIKIEKKIFFISSNLNSD